MKQRRNPLFSYAGILLMAFLLAVNYHIFIIENDFAPAGLNGIATMIQYKTGFSISYMSLLINLPLCAAAYFLVEKTYAVKSLVFTLAYSFSYLFLQHIELSFFKYDAQDHNTIFPAIISGVISGFVIGVCLKNGASTGGMEIVSKYIHTIRPNANFFLISFLLNAMIAIASLFVYSVDGLIDYEPVALCMTYCFVSNFVGDYIIKGTKTAYKFTVITTHPGEITTEILHTLKHGATKVTVQGAYTNTDKTMLLCVINRHQIIAFKQILAKYDDTFSFYEVVTETYGNFKHIKTKRQSDHTIPQECAPQT